jgi:hypothetical protein
MASASRDIVWIASYPKSGNTWVRFMICNLLFGRQESAAAINGLAPDVHEMGGQLPVAAGAGLFKTHFPYSASLPEAQRTAAAIYIVRQPCDVLASNFYYAQRGKCGADWSRADFDEYFDDFAKNRGDRRWIEQGMGTWDENIRSWLCVRHPFPVLAVKYEDMLADPRRMCEIFAKLVKPGISAAEIDAAVLNSSFARMKEIEETDIRERRIGIFYKPYLQASIDSGRRFMRSGAAGDGSRLLTAGQRERLRVVFRPLLAELGYSGG